MERNYRQLTKEQKERFRAYQQTETYKLKRKAYEHQPEELRKLIRNGL